MDLELVASRMFTQSEFAQQMIPMPAHRLSPRKLNGDAGKMKETSMRFVHAFYD